MSQQSPAQDELEFELLAEIALGGSARVELSRVLNGPRRGDLVAVKRLLPHVVDDPQFIDMFRDEVWMTSALRHTHVVEVVGWGQDGEGPWLAVELVRGVSLQRLMKTVFETGERFTERMVVYTARCICDGLAAAHSLQSASGEHLNVVHRDLTPGNILLGFDGQVKIADFGLAKAKQRVTKTLTGFLKGKPLYMSPEQVQGRPLDGRSDLFALGVMLFELFSGRRPWRASTDLDAMRAITDEPAEELLSLAPRMDKALAQVVHGCLEKDPEARFQTALELRDRFNEWLLAHGYRDGNAQSVARFVRRNAMRQMRWFERAVRGDLAEQAVAESRARVHPRLSVAPPPGRPLTKSLPPLDEVEQTRHDKKPSNGMDAAAELPDTRPPEDSWPEDDDGPTLIKRSEAAREAIRRSLQKPRPPKRNRAPSQDPVTERQKSSRGAQRRKPGGVGVLAPPDPSVPPPPVTAAEAPLPAQSPRPPEPRSDVQQAQSQQPQQAQPQQARSQQPSQAQQQHQPRPQQAQPQQPSQAHSQHQAQHQPQAQPQPRNSVPPPPPSRRPPPSVHGADALNETITQINSEPTVKPVPVPRFPSFTGAKPFAAAKSTGDYGADAASQAERLGKAAEAAAENADLAARIARAAAYAALLAVEASRARTMGDTVRSLKLVSEAMAIDNTLKSGDLPDIPALGPSDASAIVQRAPQQSQLSASSSPASLPPPPASAPARAPVHQMLAILRTREGLMLVGIIVLGVLLTVVLLVALLT